MTPRARLFVAAGVIALGAAVAFVIFRRHAAEPVRQTALGRLAGKDAVAPPNTRVRVEIINATKTQGLARRATRLLRDRGFDVVTYSTSSTLQDSTLVLDRSNHQQWAKLVGEALGGAKVASRPDTSSYVDVTVVLGTSWRSPPQPFSP
jgi:hypothetical protein